MSDDLAELAWMLDPGTALRRAGGMEPDDWQDSVLLDESDRILVVTGRQCGKTLCAGTKVLHRAYWRPRTEILCIARAERQAIELIGRVRTVAGWLPRPPRFVQESRTSLTLDNGSKVIALPSNAHGIRGFSPNVVVADESGWITSEVFGVILPMVTVTQAALWLLTTPSYKGHWVHDIWERGGDDWSRYHVPTTSLARIDQRYIEEQRAILPDSTFRRELGGEWLGIEGGLFDPDDIEAAFRAPPEEDLSFEVGSFAERRAARQAAVSS